MLTLVTTWMEAPLGIIGFTLDATKMYGTVFSTTEDVKVESHRETFGKVSLSLRLVILCDEHALPASLVPPNALTRICLHKK